MSLKILICLLFTMTSSCIYAQNELTVPKQIDLIGSIGFSFLNNFSDSIESIQSTNDSQIRVGSEFNLSGLYIFPKIGLVSPVLGAGFHAMHTSKKINENNFKGRYDLAWASFETNVGLKINFSPQYQLYTLANFGFAPATRIENDADNYYSGAKVKNHYYFGATAIALFPLTGTVGMGGSFSMNTHHMKILNSTESSAPASFDQFTTALVLIYSL